MAEAGAGAEGHDGLERAILYRDSGAQPPESDSILHRIASEVRVLPYNYLIDVNATQAAVPAGSSLKTAGQQGVRPVEKC